MGVGGKWDGDGRLFEAGRLLTFSAFRMGAYSRCALIRIKTVVYNVQCIVSLLTLPNGLFGENI